MDPEQLRTEMKATRARIDRKLDVLQARLTEARGRANRAITAVVASGAALLTLMWANRRHQRRRALAHLRATRARRPPVA